MNASVHTQLLFIVHTQYNSKAYKINVAIYFFCFKISVAYFFSEKLSKTMSEKFGMLINWLVVWNTHINILMYK